jgi:hypothetical protein
MSVISELSQSISYQTMSWKPPFLYPPLVQNISPLGFSDPNTQAKWSWLGSSHFISSDDISGIYDNQPRDPWYGWLSDIYIYNIIYIYTFLLWLVLLPSFRRCILSLYHHFSWLCILSSHWLVGYMIYPIISIISNAYPNVSLLNHTCHHGWCIYGWWGW